MELSASLHRSYQGVRDQTPRLTETLSVEDMAVQSMPDASPGKWHLAHTSWFFEEFILREHHENYRCFDRDFSYLFNSYYEAAGERHPRPDRGLLTRPGLSDVLDYRAHVDASMQTLMAEIECNSGGAKYQSLRELVITGLHHEMQHQELLLTDMLHLMSFNPMCPAVFSAKQSPTSISRTATMKHYAGGLVEIGADNESFSYDCERPRHQVLLGPYALADRPVTNGEWLEFMEDGGYGNPMLWLADGWETCQRNNWRAPLYWRQHQGEWHQFGLDGLRALNLAAPVCHISYYEADAYANWAGKRLPSEQEWEHGVAGMPVEGNFLNAGYCRPQAGAGSNSAIDNNSGVRSSSGVGSSPGVDSNKGIHQAYGDVWEWTRSPYVAYPGFTPESGALQEYNGKFMINQLVLKGGSCVSPRQQLRPSYRNFFFPHQRWQFTGLRLAEDN